MIALVLSSSRVTKIKNSLFSGLDLLKRHLWTTLCLEAMLKPKVHVDICGPITAGSCVDVPRPSYY